MQDIFQHVYDVKIENGRYVPRRFSDKSIEALNKIRPMFKGIARCPAGITLKFYTDAEVISFDYKYDILYTRAGGFDIYEQGQMTKAIALPMESCEGTFSYQKETSGEVLIEIFLPSNGEIELWNFQAGNFRPAVSDKKLVLYYGDSLTHSAYNTNPSLSWVSRVSRMTGTDYINRGVGSLFYDASYLDDQEGLDPWKVFIEFGGNDLVKHDENHDVVFRDGVVQYCKSSDIPELEQKAREYLSMMKRMYPAASIYVLSRIRDLNPISEELLEVERLFNQMIQKLAHDIGLKFIDTTTIIIPQNGYYVVDNIHYNEIGNKVVAEGMQHYVESASV